MFKKYYSYNEYGKIVIHTKLAIVLFCLTFALILIISNIYIYQNHDRTRNFYDIYIFRKEVNKEALPTIPLDSSKNPYVCTVSKYIIIIQKDQLIGYVGSKKAFELSQSVNNPIISTGGEYLAVAEKKGNKFYIVNSERVMWAKEIEGQITSISVNKNGYVALVFKQSSYKSVIKVFDNTGKELFTNYLANTYAQKACISNDNKLLVFAEVNTDKIKIESNIKVISIEKAIAANEESIVNTYANDTDTMVIDIYFASKSKIVALYNNKVMVHENGNSKKVCDIDQSKTILASIEMEGKVIKCDKAQSGLFSNDTEIKIIDVDSKKETVYSAKGIPKDIKINGNDMAINLGSQMQVVNNLAWMIKKVTSNSEISQLLIYSGGAGIVYKDKIEIINY